MYKKLSIEYSLRVSKDVYYIELNRSLTSISQYSYLSKLPITKSSTSSIPLS